jgi:hypothetical protein
MMVRKYGYLLAMVCTCLTVVSSGLVAEEDIQPVEPKEDVVPLQEVFAKRELIPASDEEERQESEEDKPARRLSESEDMAIQTRRAAEMPKDIFENPPVNSLTAKGRSVYLQGQDAPYLHRIHPNAYYYPISYKFNGEKIELSDGSIWYVHPYYRTTIMRWALTDAIFIKPNAAWFSAYRYVLQNRVTGDVVEVNLEMQPLFSSIFARWIVDVDYLNGAVVLNDGSLWFINFADRNLFNQWLIGDRIVVGVNNHWKVAAYPHILINTNIAPVSYCEADFAH